MKGDFTRNTHSPAKHYSRVLMQQGRVQIDADWNEQTSILLGYMRALTRDVFGKAAGPAAACGFKIAKNLPGTAPKERDLPEGDFWISPGRYYVNGIPVELEQRVRYSKQLGYPWRGAEKIEDLSKASFLAYLDVWEDFVSADQDDHIREVALGGVDTCGRGKVNWQVRVLIDPKNKCNSLDDKRPTGTGTLKAWAKPGDTPDSLCTITPDAQYRGAENQLYRVEIHHGSELGGPASFKWSRDNGSVVFPVLHIADNVVSVAHLGRDECSSLVPGNMVELIDDAMLMRDGAGLLARVAHVDRDDLTVTLELPDGIDGLPGYGGSKQDLHRLLRRWDHIGDLCNAGGAVLIDDAVHELEDGVKIQFAKTSGDFRSGDFWLIPARVATGQIEWPGAPDNPDSVLPHGPLHYYAPLALFASGVPSQDCRTCLNSLPAVVRQTPAAETVAQPPKVRAAQRPPK